MTTVSAISSIARSSRRLLSTIVAAGLSFGVISCAGSRNGVADAANGEFQKCIEDNLYWVQRDDAREYRDSDAVTLYGAGECAEALGDRDLAISFYQKSVSFAPLKVASSRIAALSRGEPLLPVRYVMNEAAKIVNEIRSEEAATEEDSSAMSPGAALVAGALIGLGQPGFSPGLPSPKSSGGLAPNNHSANAAQTIQSSYRDATSCASLSRTNNPAVLDVSNRCGGKITVWLGTPGERGENITVAPNSTRGYTTINTQIAYACFNAPGEVFCEKPFE